MVSQLSLLGLHYTKLAKPLLSQPMSVIYPNIIPTLYYQVSGYNIITGNIPGQLVTITN